MREICLRIYVRRGGRTGYAEYGEKRGDGETGATLGSLRA